MQSVLDESLSGDFISMTNVQFQDIIINFGFGTKAEKKKILEGNADKKVFMDLTCFDPQEFYQAYTQLKGSFAALFCDENKKIDTHLKESNPAFLSKMKELGYSVVETSIISCGFIFPRTIAQIINEAYFALEEEVASKSDIDRAMKFGVNYPKGPFEWASQREKYVVTLLDELYAITKDGRYRVAASLRNSLS
jgi:3-hydroxybutyryl-CoA dehydrogenase